MRTRLTARPWGGIWRSGPSERALRKATVDTFGVGADHAVTMAAFRDSDDQSVTIRSINSGDRQKLRGREKRQYANPRAMWGWRLRDRLQKGTITLPDDRELRRQIVELRQSPRNDGLLELEAKKDMSGADLGRSPDDLDAVLLGELERSRPFTFA